LLHHYAPLHFSSLSAPAGVGLAMAVSGNAQAGQNLAPWASGAPQAEQWMFIGPHFCGEGYFVPLPVAETRVIFAHQSGNRHPLDSSTTCVHNRPLIFRR
jgi:hypothetical protein